MEERFASHFLLTQQLKNTHEIHNNRMDSCGLMKVPLIKKMYNRVDITQV